jgi:hypothetical protein
LLVVDQPRPWQSKIQNSLNLAGEWLALTEAWRANQQPFSLLARASDQGQVHLFRWNQGTVEELDHPQGTSRPVSPKWLVCTHGSRDACCGAFGGRLAASLRTMGEVWEVSHLGGHRFAPTFWHLPSWRLYGRLPLDSALLADWSQPRYLRGNAAYPPRIQVLEAHLQELRSQWPRHIQEQDQGYRVDWYSGRPEYWKATFLTHSHRGPQSCRDIPHDMAQSYQSYEVVESECVGWLP